MVKSRAYSIFLLKTGFDSQNAIKDPSKLKEENGFKLPTEATLFLLTPHSSQPWWKEHFGIQANLKQSLQGALIFLPCDNRIFVLSFGPGFHHLKEESYEYDFGLLATLNSVDSKMLKSTDTIDPSGARRKRTQLPIASDLTAFDIDRDISILKNLTGKTKTEFKSKFTQVTGSSSLRISSSLPPSDLPELCHLCLKLYHLKDYLSSFPDIQNIVPLRDPKTIQDLNDKLLIALRSRSQDVALTIPDIIEYRDHTEVSFSGYGKSKNTPDADISNYYAYIEQHKKQVADIALSCLKSHCLNLIDNNGNAKKAYSIYNSIIFETTLHEDTRTYHLIEGSWYAVEGSYTAKLKSYLDPLCEALPLPDYKHSSEGDYNKAVPALDNSIVNLDKTSIHPAKQTQVEPCDLYGIKGENSCFYHVKISTRSAQLSHLFNQGINAIELLRTEDKSREKLKSLILDRVGCCLHGKYTDQLNNGKYKVIFSIVTQKDAGKKSDNLPLFSRISLYRTLRALQLMDVERSFGFITDKTSIT
ncbi:MAG: TIGR04141 family sporadically distributed protein [Humidesulfovibrio sp.]|nr:TIGR04141 family sporadically distributed protein [Humidesulfovibrio sp.]